MDQHILVERGASKADCLQKIVQKYGIYFTVIRQKTLPRRFFGLRREEVELEFYLSTQLPPRNPQPAAAPSQTVAFPPQARERQVVGLSSSGSFPGGGTTVDFEEGKRKLIASAGRDPDKVLRDAANRSRRQEEREGENRSILEKLDAIEEKLGLKREEKEHPTLLRMSELLRQNEFSQSYVSDLMQRARGELSLEALNDPELAQTRFLEWIGESIKIYPAVQREPRKTGETHSARILVLVGPTGVGKTTTIAKLAANYGLDKDTGYLCRSVRMVTIDAYRVGAQHQLEKYGTIMGIPVSFPANCRDLQREIDLHREVADLILIDTIGRSPKDSKGIGEMKQFLDACGSKAEIHLALGAGTKTGDLTHIMQQFEPFNYKAVLLTKLDETRHVGNVVSALAEKDKPVSYITHGQTPWDIRKADVVKFLANLEEFRVDKETFRKRFPVAQADQF